MKIIAGHCRGMKIATPKGLVTRPTAARVREAVMSMLSSWLQDAIFIDFFAGSGAVGLEAASRGAKACYFVEEDRAALKILRQNVEEFQRRLRAQDLPATPLEVIARGSSEAWPILARKAKADVIWADPPYSYAEEWLKADLAAKLAKVTQPGSVFILECATSALSALNLADAGASVWEKLKERTYGETAVVIWQRRQNDEEEEETHDEAGS